MPKRKGSDSEDEQYSEKGDAGASSAGEGSDTSDTVAKKTSKKQKEKNLPPAKKRKDGKGTSTKPDSAEGAPLPGNIKVHTSDEGDKYIDLGKKRRAIVRSFKGMPLLDIREFYGADGQEKPGKKGIALTLDQWKLLKEGASVIDQLFADQKNK